MSFRKPSAPRHPPEPHGPIVFPFAIKQLCRPVFTGLAVVAFGTVCIASPTPPQLECGLTSAGGAHLSKDGMVDLMWRKDEAASSFELQEAVPGRPDEFHTRYTGRDLSSVRTGMAEGSHRFRIRSLDASGNPGEWSEPLVVNVEYMPRGRLILLLALGGGVALATVSAIVHGHLTHRKKTVS